MTLLPVPLDALLINNERVPLLPIVVGVADVAADVVVAGAVVVVVVAAASAITK